MIKKVFKATILLSLLFSLSGCGLTSYGTFKNWANANTVSPGAKTFAVFATVFTLGIHPLVGYINWGNVLSSDEGDSLKDLEKIGAITENVEAEGLSDHIEEKFQLSEERSTFLAKKILHFYRISKTRKIRESEANLLLQKTLGLTGQEVSVGIESFLENDQETYNNLLEKVARKNETSPEHIRDLIKSLL